MLVTPSYVNTVELKGIPHDLFLELVNGDKILYRGYVPDVSIGTAEFRVKIGLTLTNLLHEVNIVLGIKWLQRID